MRLFGRRRRVSQTTSTQTLPIFGPVSNTSEETIPPFSSISDGQMHRNTSGRFIRGTLTQDKGVGVNFDNIGELYTPAASVSTEVDPPTGSPRDSEFETVSPFTKNIGTSMTDFLTRERNKTTSVSKSTINSLPRERDTAKKDIATSISMSDSTSLPRERDTAKKDIATSISMSDTTSLPLERDTAKKDIATSISMSDTTSLPRERDTAKKDIATSISMSDTTSLSPGRGFSFSISSSSTGRMWMPRDVSPSRGNAITSVSIPNNSSPLSRKDVGTSFSFHRNSSLSPRKDVGTSFSFHRNSSLSPRKDAGTSISFHRNSSLSPRKDAGTSLSFNQNSSLSPRKDASTWLSRSMIPTPPQNDVYKSLSVQSREFFSPRQSLETQRLVEKEIDAPAQASFSLSETRRLHSQTQRDMETSTDSFGQWVHVDPNELAARMALMTWLAHPPTDASAPVRSISTSATQTEIEVNLPEVPDLPDNETLCVVGKSIKRPAKSSQKCRGSATDPKSYPRQLKPKKTTSPYALVMNSDRVRNLKPYRRCMQFEARFPKDHVVLIQNPCGPRRDANSGCQVVIRPADPDSNTNCITVFTPNPNDKPPMDFTTTYASDYKDNQGNVL